MNIERKILAMVMLFGVFAFTACGGGSDGGGNDFNDIVITNDAIAGVTLPAYGRIPVAVITETDQYTGSVTWAGSPSTFEASTTYVAIITLTEKPGYTLNGVVANFFTIAGTIYQINLANSGVIIAVFPPTGLAPENITAAGVTGFVAPMTGAATQAVGTLTASDATYFITSLAWSPATTSYEVSTGYTATVVLTSTAGYKFTAITPAVNIGTPSVGTVDGGDVSGNTLTFKVTFLPTLPISVAVGDVLGGGIIAYILVSGDPGYDAAVQHGLIVANSDQSTGIIWALDSPTDYRSTTVPAPGATGTAIGTGLANTNAIIAQNDPSHTGLNTYAAGLAHNYNGGGYTDWYLPSIDELKKIYLNRVAIGGFTSNYYWSSSEFGADSAWAHNFGDDMYGFTYKGSPQHVRAVRAF